MAPNSKSASPLSSQYESFAESPLQASRIPMASSGSSPAAARISPANFRFFGIVRVPTHSRKDSALMPFAIASGKSALFDSSRPSISQESSPNSSMRRENSASTSSYSFSLYVLDLVLISPLSFVCNRVLWVRNG